MNTAKLIAALNNLSTDSITVDATECDGGITVEIFNIATLTDAVYQQFNMKWELAVTALLTAGYKYRGEAVDGNGIHCMTWHARHGVTAPQPRSRAERYCNRPHNRAPSAGNQKETTHNGNLT